MWPSSMVSALFSLPRFLSSRSMSSPHCNLGACQSLSLHTLQSSQMAPPGRPQQVRPPGPASPSSSAAGGRSARRSARVPHTTSLVSVAGPGCAQRAQRLFPGLIFPRFLPSGPPKGHPGENRSPSQPQPWVCFQLLFPTCTHSP